MAVCLVVLAAGAWGQAGVKFAPLAKPVPTDVMRSVNVGRPDPGAPITVAVSLRYRDPQGMQAFVDDVSNPKSPRYREFLTPEQVGERFGPLPATVEAVRNYLTDYGMRIELVGKNRLTIIADTTVGQAEKAFGTEIHEFQNERVLNGRKETMYSYVRPISIPRHFQPYIVDVSGLESFTRPQARGYMTPPIAQNVYGISPLHTLGSKGQGRTVGISNWDGFRRSNVTPFYTQYSLPAPSGGVGSNITVKKIDGGSENGTQQGECDLDIQTVLAVAPLCNLIVYDGKGGNLINVLTYEANDNAADIISESWGWQLDSASKAAAHNLHVSMSAQGITYMAASGDTGTTLSYPYPNIDPEVLMVGGTTCNTDILGNRLSEPGWSGSGGGWVATADSFNTLPSYLKGTGVPTNINYRILPDVALNANSSTGYVIYFNTAFYVFGGTSGACPTFAGGLAVSEQQLIANGAISDSGGGIYRMGRIQDLIYSLNGNSSIFMDVTSGANGTLPNGSSSTATAGWDFVTGWGVIDFNAFTTYFSGSGLARLTISPTAVEGGYANATGTVSMVGLAPNGGFQVSLSGGDSSISYPSTVTIPAGSSYTTFTITTSAVNSSTVETLTATDGTNTKTATLTVNPTAVSSVTVSPTSAIGGTRFTGTVTLARAASGAGVPVALSGGDSKISYPSSVTVPAGSRTATFQISSSIVGTNVNETITATLGSSTARATFSLTPLSISSLTFSPAAVTSGTNTTGTVTLSAALGISVTLNISGGDSNVSYPATVTIPANSKTGTFTVTTQVIVGSATENLTVTTGSLTRSGSFTLTGISMSKLVVNPSPIYGGQSATGTITLSQVTGASGAIVTLSGGDSNISYPASVNVPARASTVNFTITSSTVQQIITETLTARIGSSSTTGQLIVRPSGMLSSLSFSIASMPGGTNNTGTVKLTYPAGPGGVTISLSGGDANVTYPSTVTIPSGGTQASFTVTTKPVSVNTNETLRATLGSTTVTGSFTLMATALSNFTVSSTTLFGGQGLTGTVTLNGPAGTGGAVVNLSGGDSSISYPSTVTVAQGATSATFSITTSVVQVMTNETLTATFSVGKTATFTLKPIGIVAGLSFSTTSFPGGLSTTGTVRLSYSAGPGGVTVALSGGDANVTYPSSVYIGAGGTQATFTVTTKPVSSNTVETLRATLGPVTVTGSFTLIATSLSAIAVNPTTVFGGQNVIGTVTLNGPAGTGGAVVSLSGGDSSISYPSTVTVAQGATSATFTVTSSTVSVMTNETITATYVAARSAVFTLKPIGIVASLSFSPTSLPGGTSTVGTVKLTYAAGPGGVVVNLSGGDSSVTYPSTVTIGAGGMQATFTVTTKPVSVATNETLRATLGPVSVTGQFQLIATTLSSLTIAPTTVFGGQNVTGTVTLNGPAGTGGAVVNLSGGDSSISYPSTVTVAQGATTATFTVTSSTVSVMKNETVTATFGAVKSALFTLKPIGIVASLSFSPTSLPGGTSTVGTVKLTYAAGPGGVVVSLSGGNSSVSYPSTVTIGAGGMQAMFTVTTTPVSTNTNETLTATLGPVSVSGTFQLVATTLSSLTIAPTTVFGGQNVTGTVTLNGPAGTGGAVVNLSGGDSSISYPSTVTVAQGAKTATFTVTSSTVSVMKNETITATFGAVKSAVFTLKPIGIVASLSFSPTSLPGGTSTVGTVKLTYAAGPGGVVVSLGGGDSSVSYPSTVTIGAGGMQATFTVTTTPVSTNTNETVTATLGPVSVSGTFQLVATTLSSFSVAPTSVYGGQNLTGTLVLNGPAKSGGVVVSLSGGDSSISYPATVTVAGGAKSATFTITSSSVLLATNETMAATFGVVKTATFSLKPAGVMSSLTFAPSSSVGGVSVTGTVNLTGPAGPSGVVVTLSGGDSNISYPATVTVPAGATKANFTANLSAVYTNTLETITGTISPSSARGTLTILAPTLTSFTIAPSSVKGGANATGTITLTGKAGASGYTVTLSGGDSSISFPSTLTIPAGATTVTFTITSSAVGVRKSETVVATMGSTVRSASYTLTP